MKYFIQLLFILSISIIKAQTVNDSLIRLLNLNKTPDSVKIKLAGDISWNFLGNDIEKAMFYAKKELELAKKIDNKKEIAQANSDIGNVFNRIASFDSTLYYYNTALKIRQSLNDKIKSAGIYSNIATVYTRQSKFKEALDLNFKSLKLYEQIGDSANQANILGNIGLLYYNLEQNKSANEFFKKGLRLARLCHQQLIEANILIELGGIKFEDGVKNDIIVNRKELDSALLYFNDANTILTEYNAIYNLAVVNNNLGRIHVQFKDYEKAIQYYNQGLIYRQQMNDNYGIGLSYLNLGKVSKLKKLYPNSIDFYKKAATIFLEIKSYVDLKQVYGEMSVVYEDMKDYHNAMIFHQLYSQYSDSVYTSENAKQIAEMQTKYDVEKKDLELAKNKAEIESEKNKRFITYGALAFFIVLCSIATWAFIQKRKSSKLLENKNAQLANANQEITHQKEQLSEKQNEILDSINYAKKIQTALLASEEMLLDNSVNHFILFKPKDIVSGDFTWATKKDDLFYLACCDSTGHGVPGAFMSLLNIGFLSEAIKERNLLKPGEIFDYVRDRLIETIGRDKQQDGFDGIIMCLDFKNETITYAAANNAPLLIRNNEVTSLNCNKMPVGKGVKTDSFDTFTLNYQKNDSIYLFTDGYPDQFGGPKGKKFKYKPFEDLLLTNNTLSLDVQKEKLNQTFEAWKGSLEQVDDVCVVGIKI